MDVVFENRREAGLRLATALQTYAGRDDVVVLGLPRGGVPVAGEVARALDAPLDVFLVRKLGVPGREELAMGAIASGGVMSTNDDVIEGYGIPKDVVEEVAERENRELERRERAYRGDRPDPDLAGKTAILVDDGLATGASMRAAVLALRKRKPKKIVVAVPVAPVESCTELRRVADDVVCVDTPEPFWSVGTWYWDFSQTTDEEVREILRTAWGEAEAPAASTVERDVSIPAGRGTMHGTFTRPVRPRGVVLFAHGSGSSRFSPRNRFVASKLHEAGFATLLMDLLTREEEEVDAITREYRFDIALLARRLVDATDWITGQADATNLSIGYFGSSTGAAAALIAATERPDAVSAVVSRGGRPDLAGDALSKVRVPVLLIVGGADDVVIELNQSAMAQLVAVPANELVIVPGATHLFEEPGALEEVARLAAGFFDRHLAAREVGVGVGEEQPPPPA